MKLRVLSGNMDSVVISQQLYGMHSEEQMRIIYQNSGWDSPFMLMLQDCIQPIQISGQILKIESQIQEMKYQINQTKRINHE